MLCTYRRSLTLNLYVGLKTIIVLSFILAIGFLLVILSSALFKNYLTLLVVGTYVIAPIPNWICSRAQNSDDFMESGSNSIVELGRFFTGFLVVMGIGKKCANALGTYSMLTAASITRCTVALRPDPDSGHGHEHCRRSADLWDHHQLRFVLHGAGGVLARTPVPEKSLYSLYSCVQYKDLRTSDTGQYYQRPESQIAELCWARLFATLQAESAVSASSLP